MDSLLLPRFAQQRIELLAGALRVVIVNGPRQAGKTTLLRTFQSAHGGTLRSLDNDQLLAAANSDPTEFARYGTRPLIIDEVQRGGDPLVLAIKYVVDQDNSPGQFILSGSTRFLTVPTLSESLAGRAGFVELWPLSAGERAGAESSDTVASTLMTAPAELLNVGRSRWQRENYLDLITAGGYPEAVRLPEGPIRESWFDGYLQTVVQRDVKQFADIQHAAVIPRLLSLLAARTGSGLVVNDLARAVELNQATVRNYLSYLDIVFLTVQLPGWATSLTTKATKTPKTYLADTGVAAHLLGVDSTQLREPGHPALGALVETLVATELLKTFAHQVRRPAIRYFRDRDGREVDFILEGRDGRIVAIEVKASATASAKDFRHLAWLRDKLGDRFVGGIVLNLGADSVPFGDRLMAMPISVLWHHATWW